MPWGVAAGAAIAAGGAYMQSKSAEDAAQAQANAYNDQAALQYSRAQSAAKKVPEFKPVTVSSSFGTPQYTYNDKGRLTGVSSTAAPWLADLQARQQGLAPQYMDLTEAALAASPEYAAAIQRASGASQNVYGMADTAAGQAQGVYGVGQEMYGLGRSVTPYAQQAYGTSGILGGLGTEAAQQAAGFRGTGEALQGAGADIYQRAAQALPKDYDVTAKTQEYYDRMQKLVAPQREQQLAKTRQGLFNTGRAGLAIGATQEGGQLATNPEMAAYYNAIAQQDLGLANQAEQQALNNLAQQTNIGQGLYNTGLQQYQAGLGANVQGLGALQTAGGLYGQGMGALQTGAGLTSTGANILGQGINATQAGTGQLTSAAGLYGSGTGLFGSAGDLQNQLYRNVAASQLPFATGMQALTGLEATAQTPVTQGFQYGSQVTNQANNIANAYIGAANAGSGAAMQGIQAQYNADATNPWAGLLMGAGQAIGGANWGGMMSSGSSGSTAAGGSPSTASGYGNAANIYYGNRPQMFSNQTGWSY